MDLYSLEHRWNLFSGAEIVYDDDIWYNQLSMQHDIENAYLIPEIDGVRCLLLEGRIYK